MSADFWRRFWLRQAISDTGGQADAAYICVIALTAAAILALAFTCFMSAYDYQHCISTPITTISKGDTSVTSVVPCRFDPLPIGQACGFIFAAFATLLGALSAYMLATRRRDPTPTLTMSSTETTVKAG